MKSIVTLRESPVRKNGSGKRRGGEKNGVWDGNTSGSRGGSGGGRCMDFDGDRGGVGGESNGEVDERIVSGDEDVGHIHDGETDLGRCITYLRGTRGIEMSLEDSCIQESVGHPEQNHDGLI